MKYKKRIVVFLDILGFSNIVDSSTKSNSKYNVDSLAKIFDIHIRPKRLNKKRLVYG